MQLVVRGDVIAEAWHQVKGCLLCQASASLLCEQVEGMTVAVAKSLDFQIAEDWLGFPVTPGRKECSCLPLKTLKGILESVNS